MKTFLSVLTLPLLLQACLASHIDIINSISGLKQITELLSYLRLNIGLSKSLKNTPFPRELNILIREMVHLENILYQQRILINFCGLFYSSNEFTRMVVNKYQIDRVNPWAERVNFELLVVNAVKLPTSSKDKLLVNLSKNPQFANPFKFACRNGIRVFKSNYYSPVDYKRSLYITLQKFIFKLVENEILSIAFNQTGKKLENVYEYQRLFYQTEPIKHDPSTYDEVLKNYIAIPRLNFVKRSK